MLAKLYMGVRPIIILIVVIVIIVAIGITVYSGVNRYIADSDTRVQTGLEVYSDPAYDTMREDIPSSYTNQYYNKDMPLNICDFYWACSRKSYLPAGQSYDLASYDAIKKTLRAGARLINLDVYPDSQEKWDVKAMPVVRPQKLMPFTGTPLEFKRCLEVINENAWVDNETYPLIIFLEIHFAEKPIKQKYTDEDNPYMDRNVFLCVRIAEAIYQVLGSKLVDKKYGFNGRNGLYPFGQIPISDVAGKVLIVTDQYPLNGVLDELVNGVCAGDQQLINLLNYDENHQNYGGIAGNKIETADLIIHNKQNITLVNNPGKPSLVNIYEPKSDLYNPPFSDCQQYGCQFVLMNYQLLDDNLREYLGFFKDASLVLKPDQLRYIPQPPPTVTAQTPSNFFSTRTVGTPGWFTMNY